MVRFTVQHFRSTAAVAFLAFGTLAALLPSRGPAQQPKFDVLRIGSTSSLETGTRDDKAAVESLKSFIKQETGFANEILVQTDWRELADKMTSGELQLGVFQGYEFAWAQEKYPTLRPLAVAVQIYTYPVAYVVTRKDNKATKFADLQGQSLYLPGGNLGYLQVFLDRQCQLAGKDAKSFFSPIKTPQNLEDGVDDVVDGVVQDMVINQAALASFKRLKPARFNQLKEIVHSERFPPATVAYVDKAVDDATLARFRDGLLNANKKEKGRELLTLFKITGFEPVPKDFNRVLAETPKAYPPSTTAAK